ncbi:MAG: type II secretion system protein [Sedimentisphaeraceae bacterium JB056]
MNSYKKRADGFTLIELLVVISIIALLMAVMMPALSKARALAKKTICTSNVRQVMTAQMIYVQENDGWVTPLIDNFTGNGFMTKLEIYDMPIEAFLCPSQKLREKNIWGDYFCHYGLNMELAGVIDDDGDRYVGPLKGRKLTSFKDSAELVVLADVERDRVSNLLNWGFRYEGDTAFERRYGDRDNEGANYGFGDGHVEYTKDWESMNTEKHIKVYGR